VLNNNTTYNRVGQPDHARHRPGCYHGSLCPWFCRPLEHELRSGEQIEEEAIVRTNPVASWNDATGSPCLREGDVEGVLLPLCLLLDSELTTCRMFDFIIGQLPNNIFNIESNDSEDGAE
jgi:hypothetical protein